MLKFLLNEVRESSKLTVEKSTKTIGKGLGAIGVEDTQDNQKAYRGMSFTTPGLRDFINDAILFEETL